MTYESDIPLDLAQAAHRGTSFVPEERAGQERADYAGTLKADHKQLSRLVDTDEKREILEDEFARYRKGFRARTLDHLQARSRVVSSMIAGPSNFPVRRMQKANDAEHRKSQDLLAYREKVLKAIRRKLQPEKAPIMAGDSDAVERLRAKIVVAEKLQEAMKAVNRIIRKYKKAGPEVQATALVELGYSKAVARQFLEPDFAGRVGFVNYQLTNNNANIRRMKGRLATIERDQATPATAQEGEYARLEDCPADNRVRLFFEEKPVVEVRTQLKAGGFRWARSLGCWQAYRNTQALTLAREVAGL